MGKWHTLGQDTGSPAFPCCCSVEKWWSKEWDTAHQERSQECLNTVCELYLQDGHCLGEMMLFHGGRGIKCRQRVVKLLQVAVAVASVVQVMTQAGYKQTFPLGEGRKRETRKHNMRCKKKKIWGGKKKTIGGMYWPQVQWRFQRFSGEWRTCSGPLSPHASSCGMELVDNSFAPT